MRRAPIVIAATILGTAGVLLFKPLPISAVEGSVTGRSTGAEFDPTSGATGSSASSSSGSIDAEPSASASPMKSSTDTTLTTNVNGAVETDRYGSTQVRASIKEGKIVDVTVLQYNDDDPRSAQISEGAIPTLREEVLAKQTAAVDTVSGATYTSNAYEASLQSALDKAGFTSPDRSKADTDLDNADASIRGH